MERIEIPHPYRMKKFVAIPFSDLNEINRLTENTLRLDLKDGGGLSLFRSYMNSDDFDKLFKILKSIPLNKNP